MKKFILIVSTVIIAMFGVFAFGCGKSDAPVVGTYYLVEVTADNGVSEKTYKVGESSSVTKNSFVLTIKDNYKWTMNIMLPGIGENEDGKWEDNNGVYCLKEDRDDPVINLTYDNGRLNFVMHEDGYLLNVTLSKNI